MGTNLQPSGSAPNADSARQGLFSTYFFASPNLLNGIDDSPRIVAGPGNGTDMLGPGTTLGVDVGVGNNGEVYIRGRTGQVGTDSSGATNGQPAPAAFQLTPGLLIIGAIAAFLLFRK